MKTQSEKGDAFGALHHRGRAFVIPNPWDAGTAVLLARAGFEALASTSAGYAFSRGRPDNAVGRDAMLAHVAELAAATDLPVSGDLENGFGDAPAFVAETVRLAAQHGLVGCSIEDATMRAGDPIYALDAAVDRVRAAAEAARALPFRFTLTARAENFLHGRPDLADTIARLQRYQDAGADVLYAPGLTTLDDIATVLRSVDRPVNVLAGPPGLDVASLSKLGVARISVGSLLTRVAYGAFLRAVDEMKDQGTFAHARDAVPFAAIDGIFRG